MKTIVSIDIEKMVRENIKRLTPYRSAREEVNDEDAILLDANENPFPVGYNRYPDPFQRNLKSCISKLKDIAVENIFLGNGSDEIIDLLIRAFCNPGKDSILINTPTYGMYEVCAKINDIMVIKVDLDDEFQIDLEKLFAKANNTKILFICSPNNPTGNLINQGIVLEILKNYKGIVLIDEAYIDFANSESFTNYLSAYQNLVVLQTFSKALGMAGIRMGMAFADSKIISILNKIKYPYNISQLNQKAALHTLEDSNYKAAVETIKQQRKWLFDQLIQLSIVLKIWPSHANFLLVRFQNPTEVFEFLKNEGIIVRDRSFEPNCEGSLRITIGKPLDNLLLISCLKQYERIKFN
ncbi:MAG: histidinol-phosphate transaminase [Bacteroidetes bacterium GWF2_33_16]|nr:MAG: histidinol-phosphate transaminase [Bacteroidetes bacterium GWE2_32_14]OFY02987.1 MAG: histidinol-phosphate transaminase [Bacteroidetes bacterium GWF2_33_16]